MFGLSNYLMKGTTFVQLIVRWLSSNSGVGSCCHPRSSNISRIHTTCLQTSLATIKSSGPARLCCLPGITPSAGLQQASGCWPSIQYIHNITCLVCISIWNYLLLQFLASLVWVLNLMCHCSNSDFDIVEAPRFEVRTSRSVQGQFTERCFLLLFSVLALLCVRLCNDRVPSSGMSFVLGGRVATGINVATAAQE